MKEYNFNTLQNLPVPERWIENALAIPETEEQRPAAVPFWRKPRFIAMAATLVLVSALSIALFLTMGKSPVAIKPGSKSAATEIVWSTDEYGATVATEVVIVPDGHDDQGGISPTEAKSGLAQLFERVFGGSDSPSPTTAPGQSGGTANTSQTTRGRTNPTTKPSPADSGTPSVKPTEGSHRPPTEEETEDNGIIPNGPNGWNYEKPTDPPQPYSTTAPTELPWAQPTELSWEDPWARPTDPPKPTQSPYKASVTVSVSSFAVSSINNDGGVVYCRVYDDDGHQYGDSDRFSDQHIATLTLTLGHRTLSYTPRDYGILPADGTYNYEFYTGSGKMIVKGSAKLSAS